MSWKQTLGIAVVIWGLSGCANLPVMYPVSDALSAPEHKTLGDTYLAQGNKTLAAQQYQAALQRDPHFVPALLALGNMAFEEKDWDHAASYFHRALKQVPNDPGASNNLAMVYLAQGKHLDRARDLVERSLANAGPLTPYLLDTLAMLEIREGHFDQAKIALQKAQASPPPNDPDFSNQLKKSWQVWAEAAHTTSR